MDLGLAGKTVIVTGGGSNIGRGIVLAFAREGANVVIAEIDEEQGAKVAKQAEAAGAPKARVIKTDVTDWNSVQAMVKTVLNELGKIDVVVNDVGWTNDLFFLEKPREEWEKEINLNYWSVINMTQAILPHMVERKQGKFVNIASDAGRMGEPREAVYSGLKGGVIALSKALAREYARFNINFNVVCPGVTVPKSSEDAGKVSMWGSPETWTFMTPERQEAWAKQYPLKRLGRPEDIAAGVVFFASEPASYITGQTLSVSGGFSMM